jgi:hypothetical protein
MGERGPIPKRSDDRHRRNAPERPVTKAPAAERVTVPLADPTWHDIATQLWKGLIESGQSKFYEPSDWAIAFSLCDDLSHYKYASRRSSQMLAAIMSGLSSLLVTEGDRRRVQLELSRPTSEQLESDGVVEMKKWREQLSG